MLGMFLWILTTFFAAWGIADSGKKDVSITKMMIADIGNGWTKSVFSIFYLSYSIMIVVSYIIGAFFISRRIYKKYIYKKPKNIWTVVSVISIMLVISCSVFLIKIILL